MKNMMINLGFLMIILSILLVNVNGQDNPFSTDQNNIQVSINRGGSVEREFLLTNTGNVTMTGSIVEVNLECGYECPTLVVLSDQDVEIQPNGSTEIKFKIYSRLINKVQKVDLHIDFENTDGVTTRIMEVTVDVQHNYIQYSICGGLLIIIIILIGYLIFKKIKKK